MPFLVSTDRFDADDAVTELRWRAGGAGVRLTVPSRPFGVPETSRGPARRRRRR